MIATTIEQSKHLLKFLDPKTADMWYTTVLVAGIHKLCLNRYSKNDIPAWSLSALLEVMKKFNPEVALTSDNTWYCRCDRVESEYCDNPFTAAYDVLCWLINKGLINK